MRVLITGGTGYLGRALVVAFAARGHQPVVFARSASGSGLPGTLIDGDVRDVDALTRAVDGCEAISHAAALVAVWRPRARDFDDVNVGGLENVLVAAARARTKRIVYTSSFLALPPHGYTTPQCWNDYQRSKVRADIVAGRAVAEGVPLLRVYPGVIYGPGRRTEGNLVGRLIADHLAHRLPGLVGAARRWSYAYVDDVADAHVAALERGEPGAQFHLGGENAPQIRVFEIVRALTGRRLPRRLPDSVVGLTAAIEQARARLFGIAPRITPGALKILTCDWVMDSSEASRALGYRVTPLETGIGRTLDALPKLDR